MKIRDGFVTNSSSTNFLIISKEKLTSEYLLEKFGFKKDSRLGEMGTDLAQNILDGIDKGLRWHIVDNLDYASILEIFGEYSAKKFEKLSKKGYYVYVGQTSSDDDCFTGIVTTDSFVIDKKDFYMDGKNCAW